MKMDRRTGLGLLLLRIAMGSFYLNEARHQLVKGWIGGDGLERMLRTALDNNSIPSFHRYFLEHVVLEADQVFTIVVILGELAVGTAFVLGALTRFTAMTALFMNVNFFLMNDTGGRIIDAAFVVGELVLVAFAARQILSVDGFLAGRGFRSALFSSPLRPETGRSG